MSGPSVEYAALHIRTTLTAAIWPLALKADGIGCPRCRTGLLVRPSFNVKYFELTELIAVIEQHIEQCPAQPEEEDQS